MIQSVLKKFENLPARIHRKLRRKGGIVVNFHHVGESNAFVEQLGITISPDEFERRIKFLKTKFEIVSFSAFCRDPYNRRLAAITFDDGYRSFLTTALPILQRLGCPAKVFLNSQQVLGELSWLNKLSAIVGTLSEIERNEFYRKALPDASDQRPLEMWHFRNEFSFPETRDAIDSQYQRLFEGEFAADLYLSVDDIKSMAEHKLIEWGSHTVNHFPLHRLSSEEQQRQIVAGHFDLREKLGNLLQGFALPFGGSVLRTSKLSEMVEKVDQYFVTATNERVFKNRVGNLIEIQRVKGDGPFEQLRKITG